MKRILMLTIILILVSVTAFADSIDSIVPADSIWGISRKELQSNTDADYTAMKIGNTKVLHRSDVEIEDIVMDTYYVFDYFTWDSTGFTYNGLSKIVYLLSDYSELDLTALREVRKQFVDAMSTHLGPPDSVADAVTTWNKGDYKIEIGIGNFKKYTGSKHKNLAIVFTGIDIPKPVTPPPTPVPTPEHTYIPSTPKPAKKKKERKGYWVDESERVYHAKAVCPHTWSVSNPISGVSRPGVTKTWLDANGYTECPWCN